MRASTKRRQPFLSWKKSLLLLLAFVITVGVWIIFYLRDINQPRKHEEAVVMEWSINQQLKKIDDVYKHIWDETTWIVQGANQDDEQVYLFERDQALLLEVQASDVLSKDQMKSEFKQSNPDAEILRMKPGIYKNKPVWEVYYKQNDQNGEHAHYDFYSFDLQGNLLESYIIPAKTGL